MFFLCPSFLHKGHLCLLLIFLTISWNPWCKEPSSSIALDRSRAKEHSCLKFGEDIPLFLHKSVRSSRRYLSHTLCRTSIEKLQSYDGMVFSPSHNVFKNMTSSTDWLWRYDHTQWWWIILLSLLGWQ